MRIFIDWLIGRKTQPGAKAAEPLKTASMAKPRSTFTLQLFRALGRH